MKWRLLSLAVLSFFFYTNTAFASIVYSRNPAGNGEYSSPIIFQIDIDNISDITGHVSAPYWCLVAYNDTLQNYAISNVIPISDLSESITISLPNGIYQDTWLHTGNSDCGVENAYYEGYYETEGAMNTTIFTIISGTPVNSSIASFSVIGSTTATEMIAGVGSATSDTGINLWVIVAMAISITLTFYVIGEVIYLYTANNKK